MSSEAQNVIAEVVRAHPQADEYGYPVEECCCGATFSGDYAEHVASEVDKALGGLRPEYIARHESGGGTIHGTRVNAEIAMRSYVVFPPGVDDPGSGRLTGIESRWVSGWSEA
ncbi:hypothetical protein SEA_MAHAVRAT_81 [Mycobacterium phage Mahavrat]|uniref:Uncharacterized protein n=1 Tax=Mycobacterium phage Mahavrat TaxID=2591129 RepID=A0A515MLB9_9CAUD|nr:hypothetical protein I5H59_gp81 [Mycobacterium phage Mahavrat]QDM57465.1 hypothetical protein SEA_MAHAVRAT_81 [Mycobacterium phage Mahavrat]